MVISSNKLGITVHFGNSYTVNLISQSVRKVLSLRYTKYYTPTNAPIIYYVLV